MFNHEELFSDSDLKRVGVDETSCKRGHNYVTVFVDMDESKVIYVTEGKSSDTIDEFKEELPCHNCDPAQINMFSADMSPAFKKGIKTSFPWVALTFDKFHVIKLMNEALDKVRRLEQKNEPILKYSRYLWLYNSNNLSDAQSKKLDTLKNLNIKTAKAYQIKLALQDIYQTASDKIAAMMMLDKTN